MRETVLVAVHITSQVRPGSNLSYRALLLSVNDTGSFTWFFIMERSSKSKQLVRLKGRSEPSCCSGRWVTMG